MQAFKDVRGRNPQAPQVLFSHKNPPEELAGTQALSGDNVGYVTFGKQKADLWLTWLIALFGSAIPSTLRRR